MSARTPGKWSVFCMGGSIAVVRRHAGRITDIALDVEGESKKQRKANARLISAAPDMYEALKEMVRVADANGIDAHYARAVSSARAALAKAGGQ